MPATAGDSTDDSTDDWTGAASPEQFFAGHPDGLAIFDAVADAVAELDAGVVPDVQKSQIAFRRRRGFAFVWRPGQYVTSRVPAVLSLALPRPVFSPRIKSVVHPAPRSWMHHLELTDVDQVDDEVRGWLREAYDAAE